MTYLMIQKNEKSTQYLIRQVCDRSSAPRKGIGKVTDEGVYYEIN